MQILMSLVFRNASLVVANMMVPDMDQEEKERLKAEAKMVVAVQYADLLRHWRIARDYWPLACGIGRNAGTCYSARNGGFHYSFVG